MANSELLEIRNLTVSFPSKGGDLEVVGDVSLRIGEGKIVGVVGESGCGKTLTALSVMGLLPAPPAKVNSGEVLYRGNEPSFAYRTGTEELPRKQDFHDIPGADEFT